MFQFRKVYFFLVYILGKVILNELENNNNFDLKGSDFLLDNFCKKKKRKKSSAMETMEAQDV